jgi:hypothetical protein
LLLAGLLIFSHCLSAPLDHDEHQFVAGATLLARRGLSPYRDYPYLHMPYGIFANAALFRLAAPSAGLLLAARLLSAVCSLATIALLAAAVRYAYRDHPAGAQGWLAPAAVLLLLTSPLFAAVAGLAWNHDMAEALLLAATVLFLREIRLGTFAPGTMLAVGTFLGLSIGVRLTTAPAVAAFAGWALADIRAPGRRRVMAAGLLLLGMAVALSPCAWLFLQSPRGFVFGNFGYPTLNSAFRVAHGSMTGSTTPSGKVGYFFSRIVFSSSSGFLVLLIALTIWLRRGRHLSGQERRTGREEMRFLGLLAVFLLSGSFAPAPMFIVYFYAPVPFAILWLSYAWRPLLGEKRHSGGLPSPTKSFISQKCAAAMLAVCCLAGGFSSYRRGITALRPGQWVPLQVRHSGVDLRRQLLSAGAPSGPILTMAPIIPLEGGLDIYEQFATGPFAFRVAPMVPESDRRALHLIDGHDLSQLLSQRPPMAVLFNVEEPSEEEPMLGAVPKASLMVRLVHGSRFSVERRAESRR